MALKPNLNQPPVVASKGRSLVRQELFALMTLAMPLVLAHLAQNSISFVDTMMAGRIGNEAIAGIALGSTTWFLLTFVLAGVLLGLNPIVSQAHGAGDHQKITSAFQQAFLMCVLMVVPALFFFAYSESFFKLLRQPLDVSQQSSAYLRAIAWGLFPAFGYRALLAMLEGLSDTKPILVTSLICVVLNVTANEVLMFGRLGFPKLGLIGTGYASAFVMTCAFVILLSYILWKYPHLELLSGIGRLNGKVMKELLLVGVPIGLTIGFEIGMFSCAAFAMGWFGTDELAAHQIVLQTASITFMIPLGIAIALSVRVGQAVGKQDMKRAEVAGYVGIAVAGAAMVFTALVFLVLPGPIIAIFLRFDQPENVPVIGWAYAFFAVAAMFQIFDGLQVAASNALRGLKDTNAAMILTLVAYWGLGATSGVVLAFPLGFGPIGLWYGLTIGLGSAAALLIWRYRWYFGRRRRA